MKEKNNMPEKRYQPKTCGFSVFLGTFYFKITFFWGSGSID